MMTNLMTISVKKASISSKLTTVYLSCPPLCGLFSIQQNAKGGLSYKVKKNPACRILRLRRVALATLFHSAAVRSLAERFLCHRTKFPMTQKVGTYHHCADLFLSLYIQLKSQKTSRQMDHECRDPRDHTLTDHYQDCPFAS